MARPSSPRPRSSAKRPTTSRAPAKGSAKKPTPAKRATKKRAAKKPAAARTRPAAAASTRQAPARRFRSGRIVRGGLIAGTIAVGAGLAAIPVGDWREQQQELDDARDRRAELEAEIAEIQQEIDSMSGAAGIEERGRCFGPYVLPGAETYSIPGVRGCNSDP